MTIPAVKKGDRIRVTEEVELYGGKIIYPQNSEWIVKTVVFPIAGTVFCYNNKYGISATQYEVIS